MDLGVINWVAGVEESIQSQFDGRSAKGGQKEFTKRRSGSQFFQNFGQGEVPLEYSIWQKQLFQDIDCF